MPLVPHGSEWLVVVRRDGLKKTDTMTFQNVIVPEASVENRKLAPVALRFVIVCTPSDNVNAVGVTGKWSRFAPRGSDNVIIAVTKSLVV